MIIIIFITFIANYNCQAIGSVPCSSFTETPCINSGYCYWDNNS